MQTFSLPCFSSSNRGGGVAPDCVEFALRCLFPWLQAPFCFRSVKISECATKRKSNRGEGVARPCALPRASTRAPAPLGIFTKSQATFKNTGVERPVHLFNSGLLYHRGTFFILFRLSYFPLAFRLFPPWGINQNLSERKIKTRPYWIWSGFVLYSMHGY